MNEEWIMWSFEKLTQWIDTSLHGCMSDGWALLVEFVLIGVAVLVAYALIALFLIYADSSSAASAPTAWASGASSSPWRT